MGIDRLRALRASLLLVTAVVLAQPADAQVNVDVNDDTSLRAAIAGAAAGDTITFTADITLTGDRR